MTAVTTSTSDWYSRNFPNSSFTDDQRRCLLVLQAWTALYNIPRHPKDRTRPDGGFRQCGHGIEVRVPNHMAFLATYDFDELTRMVLAAHRWACRLEISSMLNSLVIRVHPRGHGEGSQMYRHPDLVELANRCVPPATDNDQRHKEQLQ